jgi:DNA repair protein RecO (recombination protein O)
VRPTRGSRSPTRTRSMGARNRATTNHNTAALVLRRTPYRDADLVVSLFTERLGQVAALARAARKSQRRFGGSLEPFHTLHVELDETGGFELMILKGARVEQPRAGLYDHLDAMEAAGKLLTWVRGASPSHTPEPLLWELALRCLDELDAMARSRGGAAAQDPDALEPRAPNPSARRTLAAYGLKLLSVCGWRLELERCVQSGARCPEGKSAMIDPERGGLVSRAEGGAPFLVSGATRQRLILASSGTASALEEEDAELGLTLVERCLRAHADLKP